MPEGHNATIEVCNIMSFVLYTQILKQSVLKPAFPGITLKLIIHFFKAACIVLQRDLREHLNFDIISGFVYFVWEHFGKNFRKSESRRRRRNTYMYMYINKRTHL